MKFRRVRALWLEHGSVCLRQSTSNPFQYWDEARQYMIVVSSHTPLPFRLRFRDIPPFYVEKVTYRETTLLDMCPKNIASSSLTEPSSSTASKSLGMNSTDMSGVSVDL